MSNMGLATSVLRELQSKSVGEIVICAGARNAPFVSLLNENKTFQVYHFFEERSAAFFAIGRILDSGRPVAVITTSGTAAAELLPATIEADYQGLPLILLTADRPRRFRKTGSPQSIEQVGLFSHYVERSWDLAGDESFEDFTLTGSRPVHLNVCFEEPLLDTSVTKISAKPTFSPSGLAMQRPLVVVSAIPEGVRTEVVNWLLKAGRPVYLEGTSCLRGLSALRDLELRGFTPTWRGADYDGVIRIGGVPTLRLWRDLETSSLPVVHFSHLPFSGLARTAEVRDLSQLWQWSPDFQPWTTDERKVDRDQEEKLTRLLAALPVSEPGWFRWLSSQMPERSRVFVGNSLPIREWDLAASRDTAFEVWANRGVNGIDGLLSTFLGLTQADLSNWCILGDLSTLYDLTGPWALRERPNQEVNVVIINNGGGKIFDRMFRQPAFENRHDLQFRSWAEMWGWDYIKLTEPTQLARAGIPRVIEILPNPSQTAEFWRQIEEGR